MSSVKMNLSLAIGAMLIFVACGKNSGSSDDGGSNKKEASPQASKSVTTSFAALQNLQAKTNTRGLTNQSTLNLFLGVQGSVQPNEAEKMSEQIEKALVGKECLYKAPSLKEESSSPDSKGQNTLDIKDMMFEISGDKCPINASIRVKNLGSDSNIRLSFEMNLLVFSPELQRNLNLKDAQFSGEISGVVNKLENKEVHLNLSTDFTSKGDTLSEGNFVWKSSGNFKMKFINGQIQGRSPSSHDASASFTMTLEQKNRFEFSDAVTDLFMQLQVDEKGVAPKFMVNGREVNQSEYESYISEIKIPGVDKTQSGSSTVSDPKPKISSRCETRVYDERAVTEMELQERASNGTLSLLPRPAGYLSSCGRNVEQNVFLNGLPLSISMFYGNELNQSEVKLGNQKQSMSLNSQYDGYQTTTISGYSILYACYVVDSCTGKM